MRILVLLTTSMLAAPALAQDAAAPAPVLTRAPELLVAAEAEYPQELYEQGLAGEVLLVLELDEQGAVSRAEVRAATHPAFAAAALQAATRLRFSPAEVDGQPSAIRLEYRYVFAPPPPPPVPEAPVAPVNFRGLVREAGTRRPIAGASVAIDGEVRAETDAEGRFAIRGVAAGPFAVRIAAPFFEPLAADEEMPAGEGLEARYYLVPEQRSPFETIVRGAAEKREVARVQLSRDELEKVPGAFGDPVRVIESLPGMGRTPGGLGGALIVHGSSPDDTATYFEGVDIPFLYHRTGLVSVLNPEFLERIDFFPAGFSARYGRATAGVIDVTSRELSCDLMRGSGELDVMDVAAFTCIPLGSFRLAVAGRRSWIDAVLPMLLDAADRGPDEGSFTLVPVYWDYQAKLQRKAGRHAFEAFLFGAYDTLDLVDSGGTENVDYQIDAAQAWHRLRLSHRYRDERLTVATAVTPGYFISQAHESSETSGTSDDERIAFFSLNLREDLSFALSDALTLRGGIDVHVRVASLELALDDHTELKPFPAPGLGGLGDDQQATSTAEDYHHGYWIDLVAKLGALTLVPGLRLDRLDFEHSQRLALQPRLSARYDLLAGTTLKGAFGWYEKHPAPEYLVEDLGNPYLEAERARHLVLGVEQSLPEGVSVDLSGFYVWKSKLPSPSSDVVLRDGKAVPEIWDSSGVGRAYGLELLVRRLPSEGSSFFGWIAYTLSRSYLEDSSLDPTYQFVVEDFGRDPSHRQEYLSPYDQTHILTAVGQWTLPAGFEFGARFQLATGTPFTPLDESTPYYDVDEGGYRIDPRTLKSQSERLPTFHRLDVRLDKTFTFDLWKLGVYLEVLNLYNHRNVELYMYDYRFEDRQPVTFLPIIPTLGVKGEF